MTNFSSLVPAAQQFYSALNDNNSKAWWDDNRTPYDEVLKPGALALLEDLKPKLAKLADAEITTKLYRPHRDVRFSSDKTPYKTHLHVMWTIDTEGLQSPVYFFGIGLDYVTVGAGVMSFEKVVLENWRKFLDLDTDRIAGIFGTLEKKGIAFREPQLKRVPSPYPADHPLEAHLRRKGIVASTDIGTPDDLSNAILKTCKTLAPLNDLLVQIIEA